MIDIFPLQRTQGGVKKTRTSSLPTDLIVAASVLSSLAIR